MVAVSGVATRGHWERRAFMAMKYGDVVTARRTFARRYDVQRLRLHQLPLYVVRNLAHKSTSYGACSVRRKSIT